MTSQRLWTCQKRARCHFITITEKIPEDLSTFQANIAIRFARSHPTNRSDSGLLHFSVIRVTLKGASLDLLLRGIVLAADYQAWHCDMRHMIKTRADSPFGAKLQHDNLA
eukprot:5389120-Amphidinium_carterae.2